MRSNFRNTALSSLQGVSLAASSALSCENYLRNYKSAFYQELVSTNFCTDILIRVTANFSCCAKWGCAVREILVGIMLFAVLLLISTILVSEYLFKKIIYRQKKSSSQKDIDAVVSWYRHYPIAKEGRRWFENMPYINIYIKSFDGLRLYGALLENQGFENKIVICVHGFTGSGKKDFACLARTYYENGYNVLLIDNRAHGQREGKYVGFGVLDRIDVRNWVKYVINRFGSDVQIFLHGISMGGAAVLMSSSIMPKNVRGIIADCGFTSVYEIIEYVMKRDYNLTKFPIIYLTNIM